MRRVLLALLPFALVTPATASDNTVTITDPAGDWVVAGQDVLRVTVGSDGTSVTGRVELAGPRTLPTSYYVTLSDDCEHWGLVLRDAGLPTQRAYLSHTPCYTLGQVPGTTLTEHPATASLDGTTVTITAPYAAGLAPGTQVTEVSASASVSYRGVCTTPPDCVGTGDIAAGVVSYTLA
jgi:hypothetical protein